MRPCAWNLVRSSDEPIPKQPTVVSSHGDRRRPAWPYAEGDRRHAGYTIIMSRAGRRAHAGLSLAG
jgi:hypothetical protein